MARLWWNFKSMCGTAYKMHIPSVKLISRDMYKQVWKTFRWRGALLSSPSECFCLTEGQNFPTMTKLNRGQDTHYISVCTKLDHFEAMNAEKCLWPILGCKVGQSVLEFDLWRRLLNVFTKFQIYISKHAEKSLKNFEESKTRKNYHQNSENNTFVVKYTAGHLCNKFIGFILVYVAKKWVWPTFGCKVDQSDPIATKLCQLLNVYAIFQIDISKHFEKSQESSDWWADGRADIGTA